MKIITFFLISAALFASCTEDAADQTAKESLNHDELKSITSDLDSIHIEDQKYRIELDEILTEYDWESDEVADHFAKMRKVDSSNLVYVKSILDKYGWLSSEQIGSTANSALFLVIQHADQKTQEKYLPVMRQAVEDGKANPQSLALLEDRVALGKGELQKYGSQVGSDPETGEMFVLPLEEPESVNERRKSVGLGTIEVYVSQWNIEWDVEQYKKELPRRVRFMKDAMK